jgi:hypothetical protein
LFVVEVCVAVEERKRRRHGRYSYGLYVIIRLGQHRMDDV